MAIEKRFASEEYVTEGYETKADASDKLTTAKRYAETFTNTAKNDLLNVIASNINNTDTKIDSINNTISNIDSSLTNTNKHITEVEKKFNEFKSHESQAISGSNLTLTVHRSGGAKNIIIEQLNADVTANSTLSESGIQSEFRPNIEVNKIVCISASASATIFARLIITTGGVVKLTFFSNRNAGSKIYINETYV